MSFFARLSLAAGTFFRILSSPELAARVQRLERAQPAPAPESPSLVQAAPDAALQLLGLMQQEGRFVDFLQEDVAAFSDAEIGAAARVVHQGCAKALREHVTVEPVRSEAEGARVTLEEGFDAAANRLVGNVTGQAPFAGALVHRGWRASAVNLPKVAAGHDLRVLAPAEVEL